MKKKTTASNVATATSGRSKIGGTKFIARDEKLWAEIDRDNRIIKKIDKKIDGTSLLPLVASVPGLSAENVGSDFEDTHKILFQAFNEMKRLLSSLVMEEADRKALIRSISDYAALNERLGYIGSKLESMVADHQSNATKFGNDDPDKTVSDRRTKVLVAFILEKDLKASTAYHVARHYRSEAEQALTSDDPDFKMWVDDKSPQRALSDAFRQLRAVTIRRVFDDHQLWGKSADSIYDLHQSEIKIAIAQDGLKAPRQKAQLLKDLEKVLEMGPAE
jgi:hypothetical protein